MQNLLYVWLIWFLLFYSTLEKVKIIVLNLDIAITFVLEFLSSVIIYADPKVTCHYERVNKPNNKTRKFKQSERHSLKQRDHVTKKDVYKQHMTGFNSPWLHFALCKMPLYLKLSPPFLPANL